MPYGGILRQFTSVGCERVETEQRTIDKTALEIANPHRCLGGEKERESDRIPY